MRFNRFSRGLAIVGLMGLLSLPAAAADIVLQWASSNANVTVRSGMLVAVGNTRDAARFEVVRLEGRRIALRAQDGSYVRAGIGPDTLLGTGSPHIRGWETFEMDSHGGDTYSLRSVQNGKYVTVDPRGQLAASAPMRGTHAQFRLITVPDRQRPSRPPAQTSTPAFNWTGNWGQLWIIGVDGRGVRVPHGARVRFDIGRDMNVSASLGCNTLNSRMSVNGRNATFSRVMMTRMACNNAEQVYEQNLASAMGAVRSWEYREGQIAFLDASGRRVLQIAR
ncbi:META domain-containing protein [Ancylobacter sp. A5.8]|uniref:META domain-containing protein n=1 Tax=Ancylobacter gelatini TaxID=2919920 RepID=UPI001F4DDC11|nr:META domain-containing protein [Ancylobacter gelatini]MCJ8144880.1 META domain-containing protein [Ancylobacter gelatini]